MREVRLHGRFGQPVGKLAGALGAYAMKNGKHVQVFNSFAAFRPGGPMYAVLRTDAEPIRERSSNNTRPDVVIVLDNSLFASQDVTKGLKEGGIVMALGIDGSVLGEKGKNFSFVQLDSFVQGRNMSDIESGIINSLKQQQIF